MNTLCLTTLDQIAECRHDLHYHGELAMSNSGNTCSGWALVMARDEIESTLGVGVTNQCRCAYILIYIIKLTIYNMDLFT